jgi:(S)-ureidoglycine aminohydrolase
MKFSGVLLIGLFSCLFLTAQVQPLVPAAYYWDSSPVTKTKTGTSKKIFSGSGIIFSEHEMNGIALLKGKSITYQTGASGNELFFVIKNGPVSVQLNGQTYALDRGSIIVLLPGDKVIIENTGGKTAEFYQMIYRSIAAPDNERGKKAGPSFVMNWNDMVVKPTDKGSTRQLFTRPTTMIGRFDIHVTQLNEGFNSHPPHTHKNEEIILMLDGNAEMVIGDGKQKANGGDVVWMGSMISHNLTNVGKTPCLYFAIQWN